MKAFLTVYLATFSLFLAPLGGAGIVEEETWYNAEGKVVKKVKRTLTGADAKAEPSWEPAWVIRERERGTHRATSYRAPRRAYRGFGGSYGAAYSYPYSTRYCLPSSYVRSGITGFLRTGNGKSRWGLGYRSRGLGLRFTR